jgi:protein-tyrosine-phosphatase/predicted ATP-grasp superfamily ATP-dependent carboligase
VPPESRAKRKVLVLGHDTRSFLTVIRSLGRAGIEVHIAWFEDGAPALRSRYIAAAHRIPSYRPGTSEWKHAFVELMRREAFDLVIPCDDQRGLPLAAHRDELDRWGRIALPGQDALATFGDKHRTTALARALGVPVPREVIISGRRQLSTLRDGFAPPLILKPPSSYALADVEVRRMVRMADSWEAAERLMDEMLSEGPVAVQEHCRGNGIGVELLLNESVPLLVFQHVRLHEPLRGGGSSYRRGVPVSRELLDAALRLLGAVRYTGVAMVEFKRDPASGRWVLLEVNARFWGSLPLALASGANFPLRLFQLIVEGRTEFPQEYRVGLCARNLRADAGWHVANARADRSNQTLNTRPWPGVVLETCFNVLTARERSDTFTLDDPAPGLAEVAQLVRDLGRRGRLLASTVHVPFDRRRRRRRRLQAATRAHLDGAGRVLFVCKGNICRSPFAAAIAQRSLRNQQEICSAGFLQAGRRPPAEAIAAAAIWNVDLTAHHSRVVSPELVAGSDAIFVFDHSNYTRMVTLFPGVKDRVHLLGALDASGSLVVADPWGRGPDAFAVTYRRIVDLLSGCAHPASADSTSSRSAFP